MTNIKTKLWKACIVADHRSANLNSAGARTVTSGFCISHQLERPGVVYHIPCTNCPKAYIGQTGRTLTQCLKEHRRAVTNGDLATSALAEHAHSSGHSINWTEARVIATCSHTCRQCFLESWMIQKETNHLHE